MYIPEFWCGVGVTIIIEIIALILWVLISMKGNNNEDNND